MADRAEWLAERRKYVCGSDVAAIMGCDPFGRTPYDVWCDKLGLRPDSIPTENQQIGSAMESTLAELYAAQTGHAVTRWGYNVTPSKVIPWTAGSFDAISTLGGLGVEFKNVSAYARWWGDQEAVPLHVEMQCQWYMIVTGLDRWDVAALFGGSTFCVYQLTADFWMQFAMLTAADKFWREHVLANVAPEATTPKDALDAVRRLPQTSAALRWVNADEELIGDNYFAAVHMRDQFEQAADTHKAKIITIIGADAGIEGPDWLIIHKPNKNGAYRFVAKAK